MEYFFDPTLALPPDHHNGGGGIIDSYETPAKSSTIARTAPATTASRLRGHGSNGKDDAAAIDDAILFASRHLFMPCTIVKDIESSDDDDNNTNEQQHLALVKTSDGQLHKIRHRHQLIPLTLPEDYIGVPDILHLPNVTEASLLHALRIRYNRDEIYTRPLR